MEGNGNSRLDRMFLQAMIAADRAETDLRCYFITHHAVAGVSDLDEFESLRLQQQRAMEARHRAYLALVGRAEKLQPVGG